MGMITKEKIDRINQLAKKSKEEGLSEEEKIEQQELRKEYIGAIKANVKAQADRIKFVEDMSEEELNAYRKGNQKLDN